MKFFVVVCAFLILLSCSEEVLIKPKAMLRLEYPEPFYKNLDSDCPFQFEINMEANTYKKDNCWINIEYPKMKATVYLTYRKVGKNIDSLLFDAQKLTYDHTIKAAAIQDLSYEDSIKNVYGMYYEIGGNAATSTQFFVTDTLNHFITGSVYFNSKPNFDSIFPAVEYLRRDVRKILETIEWKE